MLVFRAIGLLGLATVGLALPSRKPKPSGVRVAVGVDTEGLHVAHVVTMTDPHRPKPTRITKPYIDNIVTVNHLTTASIPAQSSTLPVVDPTSKSSRTHARFAQYTDLVGLPDLVTRPEVNIESPPSSNRLLTKRQGVPELSPCVQDCVAKGELCHTHGGSTPFCMSGQLLCHNNCNSVDAFVKCAQGCDQESSQCLFECATAYPPGATDPTANNVGDVDNDLERRQVADPQTCQLKCNAAAWVCISEEYDWDVCGHAHRKCYQVCDRPYKRASSELPASGEEKRQDPGCKQCRDHCGAQYVQCILGGFGLAGCDHFIYSTCLVQCTLTQPDCPSGLPAEQLKRLATASTPECDACSIAYAGCFDIQVDGQDPCGLAFDACLHANNCPHDDAPPVTELPPPADPPADLPIPPMQNKAQDPKCDVCIDKYIECRNNGLNPASCDNGLTSCLKEQGCANPPPKLVLSGRDSSVDPRCDVCIDKYLECRQRGLDLGFCDNGLTGCLVENGCPNSASKSVSSVAKSGSDCKECTDKYLVCRSEFNDDILCGQGVVVCEQEHGCRPLFAERQGVRSTHCKTCDDSYAACRKSAALEPTTVAHCNDVAEQCWHSRNCPHGNLPAAMEERQEVSQVCRNCNDWYIDCVNPVKPPMTEGLCATYWD